MVQVAEAISKVREILKGIDQEDLDPDGWWETSTGAEFGKRKLAEVEELIREVALRTVEDIPLEVRPS